MYIEGKGVNQDYNEAARWFRLAAVQGYTEAQYNLGVVYQRGNGVAQDYKEAVRWWMLAAQQGLANAQFNLGQMYRRGEGVAQDYKEVCVGTSWQRNKVMLRHKTISEECMVSDKVFQRIH